MQRLGCSWAAQVLSDGSGRVKPKEKLSFGSSLTATCSLMFPSESLGAQFGERLQAKLGGTRCEVLAGFRL